MSDNLNQTITYQSNESTEHGFTNQINKGSKAKTTFYFILGLFSLCLGLIGLILPILPTTPFILLASYCFMRSSPKFFVWIRYHPKFQNSFDNKGLTKRGKITILTWAWLILIIGTIITTLIWLKILLISIGCIKTLVFVKFIRTVPVELDQPNK